LLRLSHDQTLDQSTHPSLDTNALPFLDNRHDNSHNHFLYKRCVEKRTRFQSNMPAATLEGDSFGFQNEVADLS
jgi:hypothetical protein